MSAIITDQFRILNAKNFISGVTTSSNSYYTFLGLPNSSSISEFWDQSPPVPRDCFNDENLYWETMVSLKKINKDDIGLVIPKRVWSSGTAYDYYRHDYSISNLAGISSATNLYSSFYYVMNSEYRVYICLQNGTDPENPQGRVSLNEPTFVDLEPRAAGASGDGYVWKYLYTIKPSEIIKFESTNFIPVPSDWETSIDNAAVRNNAVSGSIKTILIKNRGENLTPSQVFANVKVRGDGVGCECTIVTNDAGKVESITVTNQGYGYTYGTVDLESGGITSYTTIPLFDVVIPPKGGHGADIYRELGAYNVLIYSRIENDVQNPDFITGNQVARVGIIENPRSSNSILNLSKASAVYALKLTGIGYSTTTFTPDSIITQTVGTGITARGYVIGYDQTTGVLKYWQDRSLAGLNSDGSQSNTPTNQISLNSFTSSPLTGGGTTVYGGNGSNLNIDTSFTGDNVIINNTKYYFGQTFYNGVSLPEVIKYSGNIIHVDNRPSITRSANQKEDIKIILQF